MDNFAAIPVLILKGSPAERGQTHGEALKDEILELITRWKRQIKDAGIDPDAFIDQFLQETNFMAAIKRWTPGLLEEVRGIAQGAGVDFETIFALQLFDEEWHRRNEKLWLLEQQNNHCSALGVFGQGDSAPLLAQNMDLPGHYDGGQVLLHIKDPESSVEAFVFTAAGIIALNGVNSHGVGICCNTLPQLNHAPHGLPVAFIVRGVLAQPTHQDAVAFINGIKHASGQNYIVGGPQETVSLECSSGQVCQYIPYPGAKRVYHTNHTLVNDEHQMFHEYYAKLPPNGKQKIDQLGANSFARFDLLENRLRGVSKVITVEEIKSILSSHDGPVCVDRKKGQGLTFGCTIAELSMPPVLHLAPGPPCSTDFETYTF